MEKARLAIIIATKERRAALRRLLKSVSSQDIMPEQVVIVDGGIDSARDVADDFTAVLRVTYLVKIPASLTAQRNAGIAALDPAITHVAFLDDDVVLKPGGVKAMMGFWASASVDTAGAGFNNVDEPCRTPGLLAKLFLVDDARPGRVLRSGFQSRPFPITGDTEVEWLGGYAMVFRRKILDEFKFDEWYGGYARYEDLDFSHRVRSKYKLFVVQKAFIKHYNSREPKDFSYTLGKMQVVNRLYFVGKNRELSLILCYWALLGLFLNNFVKSFFSDGVRYRRRALGNLAGLSNTFLSSANMGDRKRA